MRGDADQQIRFFNIKIDVRRYATRINVIVHIIHVYSVTTLNSVILNP